ncbi:helix-turn-helix domain-containing protein [Clostridium senegalense]|uniref:helix-turn-helix domain-containing protein n=1 Tax=Clostridium senegalense TaxID=1465809 RepID=UPI000288ABC2|nr:helix-turn-helix transcriptional regulator [Clostridium senegalense]
MAKIHERIREERIRKDINQPELAKILNISKQTVSNWENGKRTPDIDTLENLAKFFDVSTDYLLGRSDIRNPNLENKFDTWNPKLTKKDEKDIEKRFDKIINGLENEEGLMLNGEVLDDVTKQLLAQSIKNGLEYAKLTSKKKFTPKKYRKNNND